MSTKLSISRRVIVGLATSLFSVGAAHADSVLLRETGLGNGMYSGGLLLPVQSSSANYWSGFQTIAVVEGTSTSSFQALCVDPFQWSSSSNTTYNAYAKTDLISFFGSKSADIVALYNEGFAAAQTGNLNAAAMQLALWEVANDNKDLTTGGVHTVTGTNSGLTSAAQGLLDNLGAYVGPSQYTFTLYTSASNQDFLVATPVPEPETYAMMIAGLGLLGLMARRRKLKEVA